MPLLAKELLVTTAPDNLKAARQVLLDHLPIDAAALGIVGDAAHRGGYHCGADRVVPDDYSVVESSRDRTGLAEWACALDVGAFSVSVAGKAHNLPSFSIWLVAQCKAGTADTKDIREVIYSPDGTVVKRWDRLGKRTGGDDTHRWHTHISFHRDAIKAGRDQVALFTRYLTEIGILEDEVTLEEIQRAVELGIHAAMTKAASRSDAYGRQVGDAIAKLQAPITGGVKALGEAVARESSSPDEVRALLSQIPQPPPVDVDQLAGALTERLKAALPADAAVTDEQLARVLRDVLGSLNDSTPQG